MPRKYRHKRGGCRKGNGASMRPGRMPRKYRNKVGFLPLLGNGFNEAGADAPEIPKCQPLHRLRRQQLQ